MSNSPTYAHAHVRYKGMTTERITFLRFRDAEDNSALHSTCNNCGAEVHCEKPQHEDILSLACSKECKDELNWKLRGSVPATAVATAPTVETKPEPEVITDESPVVETPVPVAAPAKPSTCPECGGNRRGRGYAHNEGCSKDTRPAGTATTSDKPPCPTCGGPAFGRGWNHTEECPDSTPNRLARQKEAVERSNAEIADKLQCPDCGGKRTKKRFKHADACPRKACNIPVPPVEVAAVA